MNRYDITAITDVLADIDEISDSLSIEEAADMLQAVEELMKAVRQTKGLLETQLINTLESPRVIDNRRYAVKNDGKWRPDHSKVQAAVKSHSLVDRVTGEMFEAPAAVDRAMTFMHDLYVSPQGMPKVGGLGELGLDKPDVARFDKNGKRLSVEEVLPGVEVD